MSFSSGANYGVYFLYLIKKHKFSFIPKFAVMFPFNDSVNYPTCHSIYVTFMTLLTWKLGAS